MYFPAQGRSGSRRGQRREMLAESCQTKPNLERNYPAPIDLAPDGFPFDAESIGKSVNTIQIWFGLTIGKYFAARVTSSVPGVARREIFSKSY